ncbi:MAG TPA: metalloregulator ArsR/SmtB family transcription factor [Myxococcaceae bacterium]|nr:metalloregulator ArsR/SmtB family transcription factor [Myxococcaceae bacterium]
MRRADVTGLQRSAPVFAALGDPRRLSLVQRLSADGPSSLVRLTEGTGITRQGVSKHLRVLEEAGLVRSARQGRERIWELEIERMQAARAALETISAGWDAALGRLQAFVEREP